MDVWLLAGFIVVIVGIIVSTRTKTARRWYNRTETVRKVGSVIVGTLIAVVFLASGDPMRSLIGILLIAVGALYVFIEEPWRQI